MHVKSVKQHGKILTRPPEIWSKPPDQFIKPVNYSLFKIGKKIIAEHHSHIGTATHEVHVVYKPFVFLHEF